MDVAALVEIVLQDHFGLFTRSEQKHIVCLAEIGTVLEHLVTERQELRVSIELSGIETSLSNRNRLDGHDLTVGCREVGLLVAEEDGQCTIIRIRESVGQHAEVVG